MNDPLQLFREVIVVSGVSAAVLGAVLLLLTVWRPHWRRLLNAEGAFWRRFGLTDRWAWIRRFEESRAVVYVIVGLLVLHLMLLATAAGAWVYFAQRLRKAPHPAPQPAAAHSTQSQRDQFIKP